MSERARLCLFLPAAAVFGSLFLRGLHGLPRFGNYPGPYGFEINAVAVLERHVTNMPTAVNFDYRGFDTLGEEYILFSAIIGLSLLLREARGDIEDEPRPYASDRDVPRPGDAVRWLGLVGIAVTLLFGAYIVAHAQLTPGGGFQGGAVLGTAVIFVYLVVGYRQFRSVRPDLGLDMAEAAGAGGYAVIGLATMLASGVFLTNCLPLGTTNTLFSAGTIPVINFAVGLEVAAAFVILFSEFLKDTRKPFQEKRP